MADLDTLSSAGRKLYDSLHTKDEPYALTALIVEAARIKDRLAQFDRALSGDADCWMQLVEVRGEGDILEIRVDSALQESRQQANVLRQLVSSIQAQKGTEPAGEGDDGLADL